MSEATVETEAQRRVRWWHLIAPVVAMFGGPLVAGFAAVFIAMAVMQPADPVQFQHDLTLWLYRPDVMFIFTHGLLVALYVAFVLALSLLLGKPGKTRMVADFTGGRMWHIVVGGVVGVALAVGSMAFLGWLASQGVDFRENPAETQLMPNNAPELLMATAGIVIIGPFAEELYFRGALLSWLRDKMGLALAIAISAAIFGAVHLNFLVFPGAQGWILTGVIAAIGVVNGLWAARTGSLWPAFATHAAFNGTMVAAAMVAPGLAP